MNVQLGHGLRRIRKGLGGEKQYGEFNMDSGACLLLRRDCLCNLQVEKGHGALPDLPPVRNVYRLPKGTEFTEITEADTLEVQRWVNEYPCGVGLKRRSAHGS